MAEIIDKAGLKNVFDDKEEFDKFYNLIVNAIKEFTEYRNGKLTYGEVMFVLESVLENIRRTSEAKTKVKKLEGMVEAPTFSSLMSIVARLLEKLEAKELLTSEEIDYIKNG